MKRGTHRLTHDATLGRSNMHLARDLALALSAAAALSCVHRAPEPVAAPPPPPPPAPTTPVVIDIPHRAGTPVAVLRVEPIGAPLLGPELDRLTRWVAHHLGTEPQVALDPIPLEQVEEVAALARDHRFKKDGPQCGRGPSVAEATARAFPDAAIAHTYADCSASPCRLVIEVTREPAMGGPQRLGHWHADVAEPALMPQWEAAAQALVSDPQGQPPALPPLNAETTAAEAAVQIAEVTGKGDWSTPPTADTFASITPVLARCHAKGRLAHGRDALVLAYDAVGAATQCEGSSRTPQSEELLSCFCDAAKQAHQPAGADGRRAVLLLDDPVDLSSTASDGTPITTRIEAFTSTAPRITEESVWPARPWLALCYGTTRLRDEIVFPVKFEIDATGHVTNADVSGIARAHALGPCVQGYLRFMTFPCTPAGGTIAFNVRIGRAATPAAAVSSAGQDRSPRALSTARLR